MTDLVLAGDIGGTKAHFLLAPVDGNPRKPIAEERMPTAGSTSCEELVARFLKNTGAKPRWIGLGIPGPVINGRVRPTNLTWEADPVTVAQACGAEKAVFVNDLVATALGIPFLHDDEQEILLPGIIGDGPVAVIAPGTGLGEAWLQPIGQTWAAHPSEAGHSDYAPRGARQRTIHAVVEQEFGQVSLEMLASGRGIPILWRALGSVEIQGRLLRDSLDVEAAVAAANDPTPLIMAAALDPIKNPRSAATAEELALNLIQECGNVALRLMATGGVVLAGGVPPRILPWLRQPAILAAFRKNVALSGLLSKIQLKVSLNGGIAVFGAWSAGRQLAK